MPNSPTIVAASLDSKQLEDSISKLVQTVNAKTDEMANHFTQKVGQMEQAIKNFGNMKFEGSSGSGTNKLTEGQKSLETQTKKTTQAMREQKMTLDQAAQSQQVAIRSASNSFRNADTLQMMQTNLDLLRERLRDARQQYSSFIALASHATTTGDKGLYQFATAGVHKYEQEIKSLIPQIRGMQDAIKQMGDVIAPQGHTIQNYVNSLGKISPELKQLGEQIKNNSMSVERGSADMLRATSSANSYTEAIRKQAQAIRETQQWKEKGYVVMGDQRYYDPERANVSKRDKQLLLSLEEQIVQAQQKQTEEATKNAQAQQKITEEVRGTAKMQENVNEQQKRQNEWSAAKKSGYSQMSQDAAYLRTQISDLINIQEKDVHVVNTESASYDALSRYLKQLQMAYRNLGGDIASRHGKDIADEIQRTSRAMQQLQSQMSRPTSFEKAMGLSERTLDDIAYKMRQLSAYRSGLDVNVRRAEIRQVNAEYDRLKKKMDEVMQKNQQMIGSNNALGRSWNYMKNRLAFYFTVGAGTQFVKNLIEVRSQYEMNERALGILINSAERGTQIFNELSQMALVSPYTLIELSSAAKQLTAYDIAAKDVVDTTRRLADMASAVGVPIERLTYALGQIKAYGYLNSRDARMFANAGIPLVRELSKYYTELEGKMVSVGDVYDRMKKKAIDYNDVMSVVTKMTDEGGKFFDFQAKMADTLKVRLANLTLAWNNMLNDMGKETQGVLTSGISALRTLFLHWRDIDNAIKQFAGAFAFYKLYQAILICNVGLTALGKQMAWNILVGRRLSAVIFGLARGFKALITSPATWFTLVGLAAASAAIAVWNMNEAQEALNKSLRDGAKSSYEETERFLKQYGKIRESLYKTEKDSTGAEITTPVDIEKGEAKKTWEAIREQIELSSSSSEVYIGKLLEIENISERVRQGFNLIDVIQSVSAALKELGDDTIKVTTDWSAWWNANLLPDGWKENLSEYQKALDNINNKWGDVDKAVEKWSKNKYKNASLNEDITEMNSQLVQFQNNIDTTMLSIINFLKLKGWDKDETRINEVFRQIGQKMIQDGQLDPRQAFLFQMQWERGRSQAAKQALEVRIEDEKRALAAARDDIRKEEIKSRLETLQTDLSNFEQNNGRGKVLWESYTKWMKEQHLSEMREMFRGMDASQIESINFEEGKWKEFAERTANQYAKEHKISYNDAFTLLHDWVLRANKWSIFIPLTISTEEEKTVVKSLEEADSAADKAWKDMQRLDKEISRLRKKGAKEVSGEGTSGVIDMKNVSEDSKRLTKALEERAAAQKDYDKAVAEGGRSKKEDAANTKAQKQAETELQKALKDEIQLIEQVRSQYKKLTDAGVKRGTALTMVTTQFGASIEHINDVLQKNGMPKFDVKAFAGTDDPHAILAMLKAQIDRAKTSSNIKPEEIKALEVEVGKVTVDAQVYDTTKITKGLNNELDKLKEEYELAVELDANPELGGMFAEMFGLDLDILPKNAQEYAEQYTKFLNKYLKEKGSELELPNLLNLTSRDMDAFREQMEKGDMNKEWYDVILKGYLATHEARKKETADTIKDYEKLLEKYSEYQYKVSQIQKNAERERETARKKGASQDILDAIDNRERRELAKVAFEEFQKSPEWVVATGDLAGMTDKAIGGLIRKIEDYKKKAKDLDPKQIKQINRALTSLYKQQRQGNPFKAISNAMLEAKNRAAEFNPAIKAAEKELNELESGKRDQDRLAETADKIGKLKARIKELKDEQKEAGKVSASTLVDGINTAIQAAQQATSVFTDMMSALGNKKAVEDIDRVFSVLNKAGQSALIGAQVGGGYGAAIGAVVGGLSDAISAWADVWSGNASITESVKESEKAVKSLQRAYKDLEDAIEHAAGTAVISMKKAAAANRELQLAELKRQLQLELSRKSKNQDDDRIAALRDEIKDLEIEIKNSTEDIVNDLLGISSIGDAAESMMDAFVEALRNGEDAMEGFNDSVDDMIANMLKKMLVSKILMPRIQAIFDDIQAKVDKRTQDEASKIANAQALISDIWSDGVSTIEDIQRGSWGALLHEFANDDPFGDADQFLKNIKGSDWAKRYKEETGMDATTWSSDGLSGEYKERVTEEFEKWFAQAYYDALNNQIRSLRNEIDSSWTVDDIKDASEELNQLKPLMQGSVDYVNTLIEELGLMKTSSKALSALQQGIQGVTEDTAGALEAYMNIVSQRMFLHTDLLTQIRDTIQGFNLDIQVATMGQILLQLQQSYQVQMSIQGILEGWGNASGQAVRVELMN